MKLCRDLYGSRDRLDSSKQSVIQAEGTPTNAIWNSGLELGQHGGAPDCTIVRPSWQALSFTLEIAKSKKHAGS